MRIFRVLFKFAIFRFFFFGALRFGNDSVFVVDHHGFLVREKKRMGDYDNQFFLILTTIIHAILSTDFAILCHFWVIVGHWDAKPQTLA